jgi:hypothetical protein
MFMARISRQQHTLKTNGHTAAHAERNDAHGQNQYKQHTLRINGQEQLTSNTQA